MTIFQDVTEEDIALLLKKGYTAITMKTQYEKYRLSKKRAILILYNSGKLLIQGKDDDVDAIKEELHDLGIGQETKEEYFRREEGIFIGSDESLKGDTFGGIVVAAVKADNQTREKLLELGVVDSKKLSDEEVIYLAEKIKKLVSFEIINLFPEDYNKRDGNVTVLLNRLHQECFNYLAPGIHVVDKYPGCNVGEIIETKAESKYVEVAAASILARAAALEQLDTLSQEAGFKLPKGSTHVKEALKELQRRGLQFDKFVKLNFSNVMSFLYA